MTSNDVYVCMWVHVRVQFSLGVWGRPNKSLIPCLLYYSVPRRSSLKRNGGTVESTKGPLKLLTSRRLPQLTLVTYYYYYSGWCPIKKNHSEALARADGEKNWVRGERVSADVPRRSKKKLRMREGRWSIQWRSGQHYGAPARFGSVHCVTPQHEKWKCSHVRARALEKRVRMRGNSLLQLEKEGCCQREKWVVRFDWLWRLLELRQANKQRP